MKKLYKFDQKEYVISFCRKYPNVSKEDIEDCVGRVTVDLIKKGYIVVRGGKTFSVCTPTYINNAICWKVLKFLKRNRLNITIDGGSLSEIDKKMWEEQNCSEEDDKTIRKRKVLKEAFATLTEEEQEIFWLQQVEKLSCEEVGKLFGITPNLVSTKNNRSKKKIQNYFKKMGKDGKTGQ